MGLKLSSREQLAVAACSHTLLRPHDYPSVDEWRDATLTRFAALFDTNAEFFNLRMQLPDARTAYSRQINGALLDDYERLCVNDAGYERVQANRYTVMSQRMLVGDNWKEYFSDPSIVQFYLPNKLLDTLGLILDEPANDISASIELHKDTFGTELYGRRGMAILNLLLPSFRAGMIGVKNSLGARSDLSILLDSSGSAVRVYTCNGAIIHETAAVSGMLKRDTEGNAVRAKMDSFALQMSTRCRGGGSGGTTKSQDGQLAATCALEYATLVAAYSITGSIASVPAPYGPVIVVTLHCPRPVVLTDVELAANFGLSSREVAVARHIAAGASSKEIASSLGISLHTARRHAERVLAKMGIQSRAAVGMIISSPGVSGRI